MVCPFGNLTDVTWGWSSTAHKAIIGRNGRLLRPAGRGAAAPCRAGRETGVFSAARASRLLRKRRPGRERGGHPPGKFDERGATRTRDRHLGAVVHTERLAGQPIRSERL